MSGFQPSGCGDKSSFWCSSSDHAFYWHVLFIMAEWWFTDVNLKGHQAKMCVILALRIPLPKYLAVEKRWPYICYPRATDVFLKHQVGGLLKELGRWGVLSLHVDKSHPKLSIYLTWSGHVTFCPFPNGPCVVGQSNRVVQVDWHQQKPLTNLCCTYGCFQK